jgi:hypothetical protein
MGQFLTPWVQLESFELWFGLCMTCLCQTRIPKEQNSSEMLCCHFHLQLPRQFILTGQQFNVRCLYCCPSKVYWTKKQVLKFVFWQWDSVCWSSSWTLRTQEAFCIGSISVRNSRICKFRSIYMAFYSPTLRVTLGGWHALCEILLKRLLGVTAPTFKELSTLLTQAKVCLNFRPLTALSNDQNDLICLSPGHFLKGAYLTWFPEPILSALFCQPSKWQHL